MWKLYFLFFYFFCNTDFCCFSLNLANTERPCAPKHSGRVNTLLKLNCFFHISSPPPFVSLTDCNWNRNCFTSRQQWSQWPLSCLKKKKILHQKVTKQTGQCLTLSSVHLDLLSCCCFCPSFWAKSLHVGIHSTALTSLLGHELSYLWDMNRTWPRAQITEREEERPWQQRAVAQLSPSSPLCSLVDFDFFFLSSLCSLLLLRALTWLVKINLHAESG